MVKPGDVVKLKDVSWISVLLAHILKQKKQLDQAYSTFCTCHSVSLFTWCAVVTLKQEWNKNTEVAFEIIYCLQFRIVQLHFGEELNWIKEQ